MSSRQLSNEREIRVRSLWYKAPGERVLRKRYLTPFLLLCCFASVGKAQSRQDAQDEHRVITAEARQIAKSIRQQTNRFRERQGLEKVTKDGDLRQAAMDFAAFMARTEKYGHEADGRTPADRASEAGYRYCRVSENIAYQYRSRDLLDQPLAEQFVQGWKDSPGHRENMLDSQVTETGIGVAFDEAMTRVYAVQLFGRPRDKQVKVVVKNRAQRAVTLEFSSQGKSQMIDMPSRSRLEVTRCYPTTVKIVPSDGGAEERDSRSEHAMVLDRSAKVILRENGQGKLQLVRQ